ncbi:MAG: hypothetical protein WC683_04155 [bacterium]
MTKAKQKEFIRGLVARVTARMIADINIQKLPDNWNETALRFFVADRFRRAQIHVAQKREWEEEMKEAFGI